jgi:hypothetical protein
LFSVIYLSRVTGDGTKYYKDLKLRYLRKKENNNIPTHHQPLPLGRKIKKNKKKEKQIR